MDVHIDADVTVHTASEEKLDAILEALTLINEQQAAALMQQAEMIQELRSLARQDTKILNRETQIMADLTALTASVEGQTDVITGVSQVVDQAVSLLNELSADLAAAGTDPVALAALAEKVNSNSMALTDNRDALAAAVAANTPAAPPEV